MLMLVVRMPSYVDAWEGKHLCEAWTLAHGEHIYRDPALYGAAAMYTPLYPVLLSPVLRIAPPLFLWGRILSLLFSFGIGAILVAYVWRETKDRLVALIGATLFLSVAWATCWYFALVRADSLLNLCWIAGYAVLVQRPSWRGSFIAGSLLALAFFAKQTALMAIPGAILYILFTERRRLFPFCVGMLVSGIAFYFIFTHVAGDLLWFYVFGRTVTQAGRVSIPAIMQYFFSLSGSPFTLLGAILAVVWIQDLWKIQGYRLALLSLPFLLAGSCFSASAPGAGANSMMPVYLALVFLACFGIHQWISLAGDKNTIWVALALLMVFQMDPQPVYRINKFRGKFDKDFTELVAFLKKQPGTMYAPSDNVLTLLASRPVMDDKYLAGEVAWHSTDTRPRERILRRMNSGENDWLITKKIHKDEDLMLDSTRERYSIAATFGEWSVWKKR